MSLVPAAGVQLIKTFEGCRLEAYPDPKTGGKPYTIGWGSTRKRDGSPFYLGESISQQQADELLIWQIENDYLPPQTRIPGWGSLNPAQQGAILSFAYNLGAHFYGSSNFETLSRVLRTQDWSQLEYALSLYRNPNTRVEEGLLRRRLTEAALFLDATPGVDLSPAGRLYLNTPSRTYSGNALLSDQAQAYLAARPGGTGGKTRAGGSSSPSGAGGAGGRRVLYLTSPNLQGEDVLMAQTALLRKGAGVVADGLFGPATETAVKRFQQTNGLLADGVIGPQTWDLLLERVLYLRQPYMSGDDVVSLQRALDRRGYGLVADGSFGPGTDSAVRQFQASQGLVADGVVGPQTLARLGLS